MASSCITAAEAARLVEASLVPRLRVVDLGTDDYRRAMARTAERGLVSGQNYDTLHVEAALQVGCQRIYTYNLEYFRRLAPEEIEITAP